MTIEVKIGPAMRTSLDVMEYAADLLDLIPEWHHQERRELAARAAALAEIVSSKLHQQKAR